jgi:hypothetical protein
MARSTMLDSIWRVMLAGALLLSASWPTVAAPGVSQAVREVVELVFRKGTREVAERVSREAAEQSVEAAATKYGPRAVQAVADGGLELIEAGTKYGDDVMRVAVEASPAARRVLALEPERMLPLVRELGEESIEIEAKSPGLARRVFANFGEDGARQIAKNVPADDLPRLLTYAEKSDAPATRVLLLEAYEKEGASLFQRIPASLVLASGLSATMLYGTHRLTAPIQAMGDAIEKSPELARDATLRFVWILGAALLLATVFVLSSFRLTPWHARKGNGDTCSGELGKSSERGDSSPIANPDSQA